MIWVSILVAVLMGERKLLQCFVDQSCEVLLMRFVGDNWMDSSIEFVVGGYLLIEVYKSHRSAIALRGGAPFDNGDS